MNKHTITNIVLNLLTAKVLVVFSLRKKGEKNNEIKTNYRDYIVFKHG